MTTLLVVEASTAAGSVALVRDGLVIGERDAAMGVSREDALLPAIAELLELAALSTTDLGGIVCGSGPGSFTSLRIAASLCKGLASAHDTPLYAVPSLLLAGGALCATPGRYLLHADALRGERFALAVDVSTDGHVTMIGPHRRVAQNALPGIAAEEGRALIPVATITTAGTASASLPSVVPHARALVALAEPLSDFGPVSLAAWEPDYGRLAEAQVKWEVDHGRPLPVA